MDIDGDDIRAGCITIFVIVSIIGGIIDLCDGPEPWDGKDDIYVSNGIAHLNPECKNIIGTYEKVSNQDIVRTSYKNVCSQCFDEKDAEVLSNVAVNQTRIYEDRCRVIAEIQKSFRGYGEYDLRRDLSTKSGQEFIFQYAKQYLSTMEEDEFWTKEKSALFNMSAIEHEEYDMFDINLLVRFVYYKYNPKKEEGTSLKYFEVRLRTDSEFRKQVYENVSNQGYDIGSYDIFELMVYSAYDDSKEYDSFLEGILLY